MHQATAQRFASVWDAIADTTQEAASLGDALRTDDGVDRSHDHTPPHDEATVAMLKADPAFAATYLTVALDDADKPGTLQ